MAEFENGEVTFDEYYNAHSRNAYELAAELWNLDLEEEGYVFNDETGSYDYRSDEPDESPKMEWGDFLKPINANEADYERFEILGHDALFTCLRIDRKSRDPAQFCVKPNKALSIRQDLR